MSGGQGPAGACVGACGDARKGQQKALMFQAAASVESSREASGSKSHS